jgi:hypothetical protein
VIVLADTIPEWLAFELDAPPPSEEVPEVPRWLLEGPALAEEPVRWAVPGVWPEQVEDRTLGVLVRRLGETLDELERVAPATVPGGRALAEAEALVDAQRRLRVLGLARHEDVRERALYERDGYRSASVWLRSVAPDAPAGDLTLAHKLAEWPQLCEAVRAGRVPLLAAARVGTTLRRMRSHLEPRDGLIDGRPAEQTVTAVVGNVLDLVCQDRFGLEPDPRVDPARAALLAELESAVAQILACGASQRDMVEQALVLLATHVHPSRLAGPLEQLLLALVPVVLEERERTAAEKRSLSLRPNDDGTWALRATLDPQTGEQLHTVLAAEARRDPANPLDTALRARARAEAAEQAGGHGWADAAPAQAWEHNPDQFRADGDALVPRSASKRLHDAFGRLLTRYLSQGLGGRHGKVPVQVTAVVCQRTVDDLPGALPAKGASGRPLARSLLRRWWCDAHITTLLMSRGWTPLGVVHTGRTLTGLELKAARAQFDQRCAGMGCCPGDPDPLVPLVPHHVRRHALTGTTCLDETLLVCERVHQDLHLGKRAVRLRDGRLITEDGWITD